MDSGSRSGQMEDNTKGDGTRGSLSVRASKLILEEKQRRDIGKSLNL